VRPLVVHYCANLQSVQGFRCYNNIAPKLSVCLCVCLSVPRRIPTLLHGRGCNLGNGTGCPLFVHCWAGLQSVHGFRCYDNIAPNAKCQRVLVYSLYAWLGSADIEVYRLKFLLGNIAGILNNRFSTTSTGLFTSAKEDM